MVKFSRMRLAVFGALVATVLVACATDPERAKREYVASGDRHVEEKKYREAIVQYRNALQHDARFGEARLKLAQAYELLGDTSNASREYIRAADALPADARAQAKAGTYLLLSRQFEDARGRADNALKLQPDNLDAQIVLGNALAGLRNFDEALKELEEAVKLDPTSVSALSSVGAVQVVKGRIGEAEKAFRQAVAANPKLPDAHLALANFLLVAGRAAEAEQTLKDVLALEPANSTAHRGLATLYIASRRAPQAEAHLKALADQDDSPGRHLRLALADYYIASNRPADAMGVLERLVPVADAQSAAQTRLAAVQYSTGNRAAANQAIDAVLARDPRNVPALLVKTRFLIAEGNLDGALKQAQAAASGDQQSIQARYLVGTIQRQRRRPQDAIDAFNEVLKINPRATAAQVQLAELNLAVGKIAAAAQMAADAAKQLPEDPRVQLTLVRTMVATGQLDQAGRTLAPLLARHADVGPVQATAGALAMARKDLPAARRAYARAAELEPNSLDAIQALVRLDLAEKNPEAARARVDALLGRSPQSAGALILSSGVYAAAGDPRRSEEVLRKAIQLDPSNMDAYGLLGRLYQSQNRLPEARASFEAMLKQSPESVAISTLIAVLFEAEGNTGEARKQYERLLQLDPGTPVAANNLAFIYAEEGGNLDLALQLAQTARQRLPQSADVADTLGWVYVKKGLASLAIPQLEEAITKKPGAGIQHYHLGVALAAVGQKTKARAELQRALTMPLPARDQAEARRLLDEL